VLSPAALEAELARETGEYLRILREEAERGNWSGVKTVFEVLAGQYSTYYAIYPRLAEILRVCGKPDLALAVCNAAERQPDLPADVVEAIRALRAQMS
jgi:hypothetical protein